MADMCSLIMHNFTFVNVIGQSANVLREGCDYSFRFREIAYQGILALICRSGVSRSKRLRRRHQNMGAIPLSALLPYDPSPFTLSLKNGVHLNMTTFLPPRV
jgi:hypothetical protein